MINIEINIKNVIAPIIIIINLNVLFESSIISLSMIFPVVKSNLYIISSLVVTDSMLFAASNFRFSFFSQKTWEAVYSNKV